MRTSHYLFLATSTALLASVAPYAHAQVVTASGGEVTGMSQKNVVDHLITADSIEIETAQLAASRTKNANVREFANTLVADHRKDLDNLQQFAAKPAIGRAKAASDSVGVQGMRELAALKAITSDSAFDRAFVNDQIESHKQEIAQLKALRAATTDPELQKSIDESAATLQAHLARAQTVAGQLSTPPAPADSAAKKPPTPATDSTAKNPATPPADSVTTKSTTTPAGVVKKPPTTR
jgi:putative membrane protein